MIQGISPLGAVTGAGPVPVSGRSNDFAALLRAAPQTSPAAAPPANSAVAGLLALQELKPATADRGPSPDARARSVRRLLSGLRDLQLGLIDGRDISPGLDQLADALSELPPGTDGPDAGDLGALRLRVRVELARHGRG